MSVMSHISYVRVRMLVAVSAFLVFTISLTFVVSGSLAAAPADGRGEGVAVSMPEYVPGEVIVKFKKDVTAPQKDQAKSQAGVDATVLNIGPGGSDRAQLVKLEKGVGVKQVVARLEKSPGVAYAEPNYVVNALYTPDDPDLADQWGLRNTGQTINGTAGTPDADADALAAWDAENGAYYQTTVAVIDTGIDATHPDLDSKVVAGYNWAGISQTYANKGYRFGYDSNSQRAAQSFMGTGRALTHAGFYLAKVGNPSSGITVSLRSARDGSDLASFTIAASEVGTGYGEVYKQLSTSVTLTNDTTYFLVLTTANSSTSNYYALADNTKSYGTGNYNRYAGGQESWFSGSAWTEYPDDDLYFRTNPNDNPRDDNGHGTHVSGIIGAETGNGTGGAGMCPGARIMPLKALASNGSGTTADICSAIQRAADSNAGVINMSLGSSAYSQSQQDAIDYAYGKGVVVLASSGNGGNATMNYPAGCANVIGVGATTNQDRKAGFSTYNSSVDVSAPGEDIYSTMPTYAVTLNNLGYAQNHAFLSGTSMACPMAAGLAALVLSRNPSYMPNQTQQRLELNVDDLGPAGRDDSFGWGRINARTTIVNGAANAWGYNNNGQVGDGSTTQRNSPVQVSALTRAISLSAGTYHSLALVAGGTVWTWGDNQYGQIGDNSTTDRLTPVQVTGLTGV